MVVLHKNSRSMCTIVFELVINIGTQTACTTTIFEYLNFSNPMVSVGDCHCYCSKGKISYKAEGSPTVVSQQWFCVAVARKML